MTEPVIRLFISSPSDVSAERQRAAMAADRLNGEFAGRVRIEPMMWEEHFYSSHAGFQDQIAQASDCDIVIAIFGARLGTRLPDSFPGHPRSGEPYPSGTAYEVLTAIEARRAGRDLPDIYVFRFPRAPAIPLDDPGRAEAEAQWNALKSFFDTWFRGEGGSFVAAFHEFASADDFAEQAEQCLRGFLARRGFVTAGPVWDRLARGSPFPGLAAFEADRRAVFFGRDRAIAQALDRLRRAGSEPGRLPFLLVIGASGTGKSSLLRAGLLPRLTAPGTIPEVDLWRGVVITPERDPFFNLAEALFADAALGAELRAGAFTSAAMLTRQLAAEAELAVAPVRAALALAAEQRRARAGFETVRPARLALAVDQAERLFTETDAETAAFFAALLERLVGAGLASVILTLRSDAYGRFQSLPPLLRLLEAGASFDLVPPDADELEQIIAEPVRACDPPLAFEARLAARLAEDAEGGDALPLLQIALARLYDAEAARGDGLLRSGDYKGMGEAVTSTARAALQGLAPEAVAALPALVAAMVSDVTNDPVTGVPVPGIVPLDRLAFTRAAPARAALLDAFIASRLLTADGDAVRPAHEALLRIWPASVRLVAELGPVLRVRRALAPLVRDWQAAAEADKPRHLEISPALLDGALVLGTRVEVDPPMAAFIAACAADAEARRRHAAEEQERQLRDALALAAARRRVAQIIGAGLFVALLFAGVAGWQWWIAGVERDHAKQALASATDVGNSLVFNLARKFRDHRSAPVAVVRDILDGVSRLQARLANEGSPSPALRRSQAVALNEMSITLLDQGQTGSALDAARQARGTFQSLLNEQPDNIDWQYELSVSFEKVGDVLMVQGNLSEAMKSYQTSRAICESLAKSDPRNTGWQRALSVAIERVGDVLFAQDNLPEALESYKTDLSIADRLEQSDPDNVLRQIDLSVSYEKVGDVQMAQRSLTEALQSYQAEFAILDRLTKADPGNAGWLRDLSVSLNNIGTVQEAQNDLPEALNSYQIGLGIRERLVKSDPGNAGWRRDLSVSMEKVGEVLVALDKLTEALNSYQASLNIRNRLAESDPSNAEWRRDQARSYNNVGDVLAAQGNFSEALQSIKVGFAIRSGLAKSNLDNPGWQRDLAESYAKLGEILLESEHSGEAREAFASGQSIISHLLNSFPDNPQWKRDIIFFDETIAALDRNLSESAR